jgi:hypothetical protein
MAYQTQAPHFIDGLYGKLIEGGIGYFFPSVSLQTLERDQYLTALGNGGTSLVMDWQVFLFRCLVPHGIELIVGPHCAAVMFV